MNILEKEFQPLNDVELKKVETRYTQDFDKMSMKDARIILKMTLSSIEHLDPEMTDLLLRRLYMKMRWDLHPERLV